MDVPPPPEVQAERHHPLGPKVFFAADDLTLGEELWALHRACLPRGRR